MADGGKGKKTGGDVYEYFANFAVGLCEGPIFDVLRVWADSNLIYDRFSRDEEDVVYIGFSERDSEPTKGSGKGKGQGEGTRFSFRTYYGTEDQMPDPFMVKANGDLPTPAHRGLAYLMFEEFPLADFGNRIPTITAEVVVSDFAQQSSKITLFSTLDSDGSMGNSNLAYDPVRDRFYASPLRGLNSQTMRIFSASGRREISRKTIPDDLFGQRPTYCYDPILGTGGQEVAPRGSNGFYLGMAASGDIITISSARLPNSNTPEIAFCDPNSGQVKQVWGADSPLELSNTDTHIAQPWCATTVGVGDGVDGVNRYYTVIMSCWGSVYFFNDKNEPLSYYRRYSLYNQSYRVFPGYVQNDKLHFYVMMRAGNGLESTLERLEFSMDGMPAFAPGVKAPTRQKEVLADRITVMYHNRFDANITNRVSPPLIAVGEEWIGLFVNIPAGADQGTWAYKIDTNTGARLWEEKISDTFINGENHSNVPQMLVGGKAVKRVGSTLYDVNFSAETVTTIEVATDTITNSPNQFNFAFGGMGGYVQYANNPETGPTLAYFNYGSYTPEPVLVDTVIRQVADRVGIPTEKVNTDLLKGDTITGVQMENPSPAQSVLSNLSRLFFFDLVESDLQLKAVTRELSQNAVTIPQRDLGIVDGLTEADGARDFYAETRLQEIDLPRVVTVSYKDTIKNYETGTQHFRRPNSPMQTMQSRDVLDVNLPVALDATKAKQAAEKILYSTWGERTNYQFALPWKYLKLDPTDLVTFQMDDGLRLVSRMNTMDFGRNLSIEAEGIGVVPGTYTSDAVADDLGGRIPVETFPVPLSLLSVLDIPYLTDGDSIQDRAFAYYWGLRSFDNGFRYGAMERRAAPYAWESSGAVFFDMVWGEIGFIGRAPWGDFAEDDETVITVSLPWDYFAAEDMWTWNSIPDEEWPSAAGRNTLIIGDEILYFKNIQFEENAVVLDTFIRGARGTDEAIYTHVGNSNVAIFADSESLKQEFDNFELVGREFNFRPLVPRIGSGALPTITRDMTGASHKPWGPNDIRRTNSGGNITISFQRRTRLSGQMRDGTGTVPNVENTIEFDAYLLAAPYNPRTFDPADPSTYVRSWTNLTTNQFTYTAAQLTADGRTQASTMHFVIFQRNAFVGQGFPGWATTYPPV